MALSSEWVDTSQEWVDNVQEWQPIDAPTVPDQSGILYRLTLTGAPDSLDDIYIPMNNFTIRMRDQVGDYLSAVIPSLAQIDDIQARTNGELVIEKAYTGTDGTISSYTEISRADFETPRQDSGAVNKSITLEGHSEIAILEPKNVTLTGAQVKTDTDGRLQYQCDVNEHLRPRDVAAINGDSFEVGSVTIYVNAIRQQMTVLEVATT